MSKTISVGLRSYAHSAKKGIIRLTIEFPDIMLTPEERKKLATGHNHLTLVLWGDDFK